MFSPRQYLGEMLGRGLGVTQLYLVFGDLTGDWAFAVVAFISKDFHGRPNAIFDFLW